MNFRFLLTTLLTFLLYSGMAQQPYAYLSVNDPQFWWSNNQGTIEDASFVLRSQGFYTQVDMYLTFSARGAGFNPNDQIEVVLDFNLPEGAHFIDSWLWIEETIIKAKILDRWTASGIYEEIVGRRQDPSILFKNSPTDYQLRIFPMLGGSSRRVKLSYLLPNTWTSEQILATLPVHIVNSSFNPLQELNIRYFPEENPEQMAISELPALQAVTQTDPELGQFKELVISNPIQYSNLTLATPSLFEEGIYVSTYKGARSNYYQMAILPTQLFDLPQIRQRKVLFLLDIDEKSYSLATQNDMLQQLKLNMKTHLMPADSFNIMYADITYEVKPVSDNWIAGTSENIDSIFNALSSNPIVNYNNIPPLLFRAVDYIKNNGNSGKIVLISDSDNEGDFETANNLLSTVTTAMADKTFPIHVLDLMPWTNRQRYFFNNRRYEGNEYFYENLTRITTGTVLRQVYTNNTLDQNLNDLMEEISSVNGTLDLYTTMDNGFCYNRYNINVTNELANLNKPVLQIGKFEGEFPFIVEAAGEYEDIIFGERISLAESEIVAADSIAEEIWVGNFLEELEAAPQYNNVINEIISRSISERVLSIYTAFIALEPSLGGEPCLDCTDESPTTVSVDDIALDSMFMIEAYPNPFEERVILSVTLSERVDWSNYNFSIFNTLGQEVKRFTDQTNSNSNELKIEWDANDNYGAEVPAGLYFFTIQSGDQTVNHKLVKMK